MNIQKIGPLLGKILALGISAWFLAGFFASWTRSGLVVAPRMEPAEKQVKGEARTPEQYQTALGRVLQNGTAREASPKDGKAPGGPPPLQLQGVLMGPGFRVALINDGSEAVYATQGQKVKGFVIVSIEKRRVVIKGEKGEGEYILALAQEPVPQLTAAMPPIPSPPTGLPPLPAPPTASPTPQQQGKKIIGRKELNELLEAPDKFAGGTQLIPVSQDGKPIGVRVIALKPNTFLSSLGFQTGDILTEVNGKGCYTPEEAFQAYQALRNEDRLNFKVNRGGQVMNLEMEVR
ncbi:MAG: hypothetical protein HYU64_12640 [Armatimonadetes bacterium]|nr:hypothetical protein [Armatimonadota bacterium]